MASLAVELKISPNEVLDLDERMFKAVLQVLNDRAKERARATKHNLSLIHI